MNFSTTLILNGGLFDFDLTFVIQAILFTIFSICYNKCIFITNFKTIDERSEFINYTYVKQQFY